MLWCVLLQTSSIQGVFCVAFCPVVTNVVNPRAFSLKMAVFGLRLTTFVTEALERRRESRWFDDVCNGYCPRVPRLGRSTARGCRGQALSTRRPGCLKPLSPLLACSCVGLKPSSPLWVRNGCFWCGFWVQWRCRFQRCLVGGVQRCCWFQCRHGVVPGARNSSPSALKLAQIQRFCACWASFFAAEPLEGLRWASFSRQPVLCRSWRQLGALQAGCGGGFTPCEAL